MREVAKALMAYETSINKTSLGEDFPAFAVIEKLRNHLANLMGMGGFQALLSRALVLAQEEVACLRGVQVSASGALDFPERPIKELRRAELLEGNEIILAQLLGLLAAFIGMNLTLQQITEVWPGYPAALAAVANGEVESDKAK
jgi:hypothetical protein